MHLMYRMNDILNCVSRLRQLEGNPIDLELELQKFKDEIIRVRPTLLYSTCTVLKSILSTVGLSYKELLLNYLMDLSLSSPHYCLSIFSVLNLERKY